MEDPFTSFVLAEYNSLFKFVFNCDCYKRYEKFDEVVIYARESYLCCFLDYVGDEVRVFHLTLPIMIGSLIDKSIRKLDDDEDEIEKIYGSLIIDGSVVIVPNFITSNLRSGHVYYFRQKNLKYYKWEIEHDDYICKIQYSGDKVVAEFTSVSDTQQAISDGRKRRKLPADKLNVVEEEAPKQKVSVKMKWLDFIKCKFDTNATEEEYIEYFKDCIECGPLLDDLANKTIITAPVLMSRCIQFMKYKYLNINAFTSRIKGVFKTGNLFFALAAKINSNTIMAEFKRIYMPIEGQKLDDTSKMVGIVKRFATNQAKNSSALNFPRDGTPYICPLNTRELKGAGETIGLSVGTISSPTIPKSKILAILNEIGTISGYRVAIEGIITDYFLTREALFLLKQKCTFVCIFLYKTFVNLSHLGQLPIKWSDKHKLWFSPSEMLIWPDVFDENGVMSKYSALLLRLGPRIFCMQPAKIVVALSNIKGSCFETKSRLLTKIFLHSVDVNCALIHKSDEEVIVGNMTVPFNLKCNFASYLELAHLPDAMPETVARFFKEWTRKPIANEMCGSTLDVVVSQAMWQAMESSYLTWVKMSAKFVQVEENYDSRKFYRVTHKNIRKNKHALKNDQDFIELKSGILCLTETQNEMINPRVDKPRQNQIALWCMFGDVEGATNEDGIVLDEKVSLHGPRKLVSIVLTMKFTGKGAKEEYFPVNRQLDEWIVFGIINSKVQLTINKPNQLKVYEVSLKTQWLYFVVALNQTTEEKMITSNIETGKLIVSYKYYRCMQVGCKLANLHGQKGIVSVVKDLSGIKCWTADGQCIHPQILFSPTSIIGRTVASQVKSILEGDLAIGENGSFAGKQAFVVHHIENSTKARVGSVKNDLMTNENGFLAHKLTKTEYIMRHQNNVENDCRKIIQILQEFSILNANYLQFLCIDPAILKACLVG